MRRTIEDIVRDILDRTGHTGRYTSGDLVEAANLLSSEFAQVRAKAIGETVKAIEDEGPYGDCETGCREMYAEHVSSLIASPSEKRCRVCGGLRRVITCTECNGTGREGGE